jgi:hypothetical protein
MGDLSFQNNVPDPLLAGKELPTFKFELEKSKGKVLGNSFGKEVTVEQLPISTGIAGAPFRRIRLRELPKRGRSRYRCRMGGSHIEHRVAD